MWIIYLSRERERERERKKKFKRNIKFFSNIISFNCCIARCTSLNLYDNRGNRSIRDRPIFLSSRQPMIYCPSPKSFIHQCPKRMKREGEDRERERERAIDRNLSIVGLVVVITSWWSVSEPCFLVPTRISRKSRWKHARWKTCFIDRYLERYNNGIREASMERFSWIFFLLFFFFFSRARISRKESMIDFDGMDFFFYRESLKGSRHRSIFAASIRLPVARAYIYTRGE